jgi:hypothetical protein
MMRNILVQGCIFLIFFNIGCGKEIGHKTYTISGQLWERTGNPIPVSNYKLWIYQKSSYGFFGGVKGIDKEFQTDNNGFFSISYIPQKGTGLFSGSINTYPITITGSDTNLYRNLYLYWYPITPNIDTTLKTIYLFKQIDKLVRKIQFDSSLEKNDSIKIITSGADRSSYKTIYGPITAGTILLDTVLEFKLEGYNITTGMYIGNTTITKASYLKSFPLSLPIGDEAYREQILIYP